MRDHDAVAAFALGVLRLFLRAPTVVGLAVAQRHHPASRRRQHGDAGAHPGEVGETNIGALVAVVGQGTACEIAGGRARIDVDMVLYEAVASRLAIDRPLEAGSFLGPDGGGAEQKQRQ